MSSRRAALRALQLRRAASVAAVATAGALALPGVSAATPSASDLQVVITKTAVSQPDVPAVVTLRLKNNGTEVWQPGSPSGSDVTAVQYAATNETTMWAARSFQGWTCESVGAGQRCALSHGIEPGGYSVPIEFETLPRFVGTTSASFTVAGAVYPGAGAGAGRVANVDQPIATLAPVVALAVVGGEPEQPNLQVTWGKDGVTSHTRNPDVEASASNTAPAAGEVVTVGVEASSATGISTGPFTLQDYFQQPELMTSRAYSGVCCFVTPELELDFPSDKVELISLKGYRPVMSRSSTSRAPAAARASLRIAATRMRSTLRPSGSRSPRTAT